ncbi:hypothetical protein ER308_17005 [Egibacter rhizosphaerae]|uniref:Uncharacterized protein n=1 Tax=Egibacter rhizosphaerae TaxID=1670831 RepID=A0A411YIP8_9ACTN|nr:hypothetical protein [Egibacter rhizosphaerae]QBI21103.1 hypothetical protein ER308_17005 [Egibacter rhizosphaerae]
MRDFEERLRASLASEARVVRPDPTGLDRVEARIRRRRVVAWTAPATAAVAMLAFAAMAVPALLPHSEEVELESDSPADDGTDEPDEEPPEVAEEPETEAVPEPQPEPEPEPEPELDEQPPPDEEPEPDPLAPFDAVDELVERTPAVIGLEEDAAWTASTWTGQVWHDAHEEEQPAAGPMAVSPTADAMSPGGAFAAEADDLPEGCATLRLVQGAASPEDYRSVRVEPAQCAGTPAISPGGDQLAWVEEQSVVTIAPVDGLLGDNGDPDHLGEWELDAEAALDVAAWVSGVDGWKLLLREGAGSSGHLHALLVDREADGTVDLPEDALGSDTRVDLDGVAPLAVAPHDTGQPRVEEVDVLGLDNGTPVIRSGFLGAENAREIPLPDELAAPLRAEDAQAWLTRHRRDVLLGDGLGEVWHVELPRTTDETAEVTELEAEWRGAGFVADGAEGPGREGAGDLDEELLPADVSDEAASTWRMLGRLATDGRLEELPARGPERLEVEIDGGLVDATDEPEALAAVDPDEVLAILAVPEQVEAMGDGLMGWSFPASFQAREGEDGAMLPPAELEHLPGDRVDEEGRWTGSQVRVMADGSWDATLVGEADAADDADPDAALEPGAVID